MRSRHLLGLADAGGTNSRTERTGGHGRGHTELYDLMMTCAYRRRDAGGSAGANQDGGTACAVAPFIAFFRRAILQGGPVQAA